MKYRKSFSEGSIAILLRDELMGHMLEVWDQRAGNFKTTRKVIKQFLLRIQAVELK